MDINKILDFIKSLSFSKILPALLILVIGYALVQAIMKIYDKASQKSKLDQSLFKFLRAIIKILLLILVVLIAASALGIDVSSLIAVLSVLSLGISLAVQGSLANVAGGIMILTSHPFKIGDYIDAGNTSGTVKEIGIAYTTLTTPDNKVIFVPNSDISADRIVNYSALSKRRVDFSFGASYNDDPDKVKEIIYKVCEEHKLVLKEDGIFVRTKNYRESDIEYVARVWAKNEDYWTVYFDILENVKKAYDENGISMAYPHVDINIIEKK